MTIKYVVLEIIDQFKATDQGQTMHFAEVSKEKTKGRFFDQSAQYMTRQ